MTALVSKKDFAAIYGCSKAYVSQLVAARRLVLSDDGKRVDVERSLELLGATSDPSKAGVRERWAAYRAEHGQAAAPAAAAAPAPAPAVAPAPAAADQAAQRQLLDDAPAPAAQPAAAPAPAPARSDYQDARTRREQAEAEMAHIELMKARGQVLELEPTLRAVVDAHMAVRAELLGMADRLAPLVAVETNPRRVWELINAEAELLCQRMQRAAHQLAGQRVEVPA